VIRNCSCDSELGAIGPVYQLGLFPHFLLTDAPVAMPARRDPAGPGWFLGPGKPASMS